MRALSFAWQVAATGLSQLASTDVATTNARVSAAEMAAARREREEITAMLAARVLPDAS